MSRKFSVILILVVIAAMSAPLFAGVTLNDGDTYFIDYHENVYKEDSKKPISGDLLSFVDKERVLLKKGEQILYDSINDKILILKKLTSGGVQ